MTNNEKTISNHFSWTELIINFLLVISSGALLWIAYSIPLISLESETFILKIIIEITKSIPVYYIIPFISIFLLMIVSIFANKKITRILGNIFAGISIIIIFSIILSPFWYVTTSNSIQNEAFYIVARNANFSFFNIFLVLSICLIITYIIRINKK